MKKARWVVVFILAVATALGWRAVSGARQESLRLEQAKETNHKALQYLAETHTEQGQREYVLEVISMGVTLDKYRQGTLWDALQSGGPSTTIREKNPREFPWQDLDKSGLSGARAASTLENGAGYTVTEWGTPVFNAVPSNLSEEQDSPLSPHMGITSSAESSGMATSLFVAGPRRFAERPDRILEDVFNFFDAHPDIPYVVLNSDDGMETRDIYQPQSAPPLVRTGYYVPDMPDSSALFLLARRERAEALRPFVYDDIDDYRLGTDVLNRDGVARRLFLGYLDLQKSVPRLPEHIADFSRNVTMDEWIDFAAKFAVRPDIRGNDPTSFLDIAWKRKHLPPRDWKPTPWFPIPWSKTQMAQFDGLPTLGYIHRPVFVKTTNKHGKPLSRLEARKKVLLEGLKAALQTLPEAERAKGPARVIAATNNQKDQLIALESMLYQYAAEGGPEIDSNRIDQFINTDRRLGNTGAATLFMQMAIGVMGSYRAGGTSLAINLRDKKEASFIFISPPSEEKRKTQQHFRGGDVFRSIQSPVIDPANYVEPAPQ